MLILQTAINGAFVILERSEESRHLEILRSAQDDICSRAKYNPNVGVGLALISTRVMTESNMEKLLLAVIIVFAFGTMAIANDIAFYVGGVQPGVYDQKTMTNDVNKIINNTRAMFNDIQKFDDTDLFRFGRWVDANTGDGQFDIIWLNGHIPSTLYPTFNKAPDGSRAEKWLDDGNIFINVTDWFAWSTYEKGFKERNTHTGAANILDLSHNIILQAPDAPMDRTAAGRKYMPSLDNGLLSNRPVYLEEVKDPWVAVAFAESSGKVRVDAGDKEGEMIPAGLLVDPVVLHNTKTDGYLAIISQSTLENMGDRGAMCSEFIKNWVSREMGLLPVEPAGKLATTWGSIKEPKNYVVPDGKYVTR